MNMKFNQSTAATAPTPEPITDIVINKARHLLIELSGLCDDYAQLSTELYGELPPPIKDGDEKVLPNGHFNDMARTLETCLERTERLRDIHRNMRSF